MASTSPVADDDILPSRHACNEIKETRSVVAGVHPHTHAHPLKQSNEVSMQLAHTPAGLKFLAPKPCYSTAASQIASYIWYAIIIATVFTSYIYIYITVIFAIYSKDVSYTDITYIYVYNISGSYISVATCM